MAKSTLDFSHPFFQKAIRKHKNDPQFMEALESMKRLIEANHEACCKVVQEGMGHKYKHCHNKIWKYHWQPPGTQSSTCKSWRMVAIVPDPVTVPYAIIAGAIYPKNATDQLSAKQLAQIYAEILAPRQEGPDDPLPEPQFVRVECGEGDVRILVCSKCGVQAGKSDDPDELTLNQQEHQCIE